MPEFYVSQLQKERLANAITLTTLAAKIIREHTGSFEVDYDLCEELGWRLSSFIPEGVELINPTRNKVTVHQILEWAEKHPAEFGEISGPLEAHVLSFEAPVKKKAKIVTLDNRPEEMK